MGGGYPPVKNNVVNEQFTPLVEFFGIPLVLGTVSTEIAAAWALLPTPRTLVVTPNNYKTNMAAIGFTPTDSHWKHVAALFGQPQAAQKVTKAVLGRRLAAVAKVVRLTVGGTTDGAYSVQIEALDPFVFNAVGNTAAEIRDGLLAAITVNTYVTDVTQGPASIDLTAINAGFDFEVTLSSPGDILTQTVQTPNVGAGTDIATIKAENAEWFDILETAHGFAPIAELAKFAQANISHFWAETNDAAVKSNAAGNIAAYLKAKGYTETSIRYHHTGSELFSAALCGRVLGYQPGQVQVSHRNLVGVTKKNYGAEAGVIDNFQTNNVGMYASDGKGVTLYNYTCHGGFIEMERNKHIVASRLDNAFLAVLADNDIIAYTDKEGVATAKATTRSTLETLADQGGTGYIVRDTIVVDTTAIGDQPTENQQKLKIGGITWYANVRIGTNEIETTGFLSIV